MPEAPDVDAWHAWSPAEVRSRLDGCPVPWMVAGGWAIDLHLGRQTREHSDLEVAIPRADFPQFRSAFAGYDLYLAYAGALAPLAPDEEPPPETHQVWVCDPSVPAWRLDTFLEPGDRLTWVSHRDERVRVPFADVIGTTADGIPYLRPQFVLLAKAKHARDKDEADLAAVLPTLDPAARSWLSAALAIAHPEHPWIARVGAAPRSG
jgi:hypothetical protein